METSENRDVDKTGWGPGPWNDEPDKRQWQDEATGLPCLIVRGPVGALCGYVGVPPDHPAYGLASNGTPNKEHRAHTKAVRKIMRETFKATKNAKNHEAVRDALMSFPKPPDAVRGIGERITEIEVHGGLNYAAACSGHICHIPAEGEPDNVWWFGFDCAHASDLCPQMEMHRKAFKHLMPEMPPELEAAMEKSGMRDVYRDAAYVAAECASLAKQLKAMA